MNKVIIVAIVAGFLAPISLFAMEKDFIIELSDGQIVVGASKRALLEQSQIIKNILI